MNNFLCCHGCAVPAPVENITATVKAWSQMNYYYISAEWKVIMTVFVGKYANLNYMLDFPAYIYIHQTHAEFPVRKRSASDILRCLS